MEGVYKLAEALLVQSKKKSEWIEDGDLMMTFVKTDSICGNGAPTPKPKDCAWKQSILIDKEKSLGTHFVSVYLGTFLQANEEGEAEHGDVRG